MQPDLLENRGVLIGTGFLREEIKDQFLSKGIPLQGHRIISLEDLAIRVLKLEKIQLIKPAGRRELLKQLFLKPSTGKLFPELYRLRRQRKFFESLDQAIQESRSFYSNDAEREAFHSVLDDKCGPRLLRHEVARLTLFFEVYLSARDLYDETRLIKEATQADSESLDLGDAVPKDWLFLSDRKLVAMERAFIDRLGFQVVEEEKKSTEIQSEIKIDQWHTSDDAAEGLMDALMSSDPEMSKRHAIVFSGDMQDRLSLQLAMSGRGLIEESERDPLYWKNKEDLKLALLPFELMGSRFERDTVIEYILFTQGRSISSQIWIKEIMSRGIRLGLGSYQGGKLSDLYARLEKIQKIWSGKKTLTELRDIHLEFLMSISISGETYHALEQMYDGMSEEQGYGIFKNDAGSDVRESLYLWSERIKDRIKDFTAPAPILRSNSCIQVFRLSHSSLSEFDHVWIYGVTPSHLVHQSIGNMAFSDRERELIGREFDCDTASSRTEKTMQSFYSWLYRPNATLGWHSSELGWNGSEMESPTLLKLNLTVTHHGAHPRWLPAYISRGAHSSDTVVIPNVEVPDHLSASHLDRYSRCAFTYLAQSIWKAEDRRESDVELWPEVRGQILHDAVTAVLATGATPSAALEAAWSKSKLRGLISSVRVEKLMKRRLIEIITLFKEKEDEYKERSETKTISLDDQELTLNRAGIEIQGRPDRIDEHKDGLFIMDFKSTSDLPSGQDMVDTAYRLQMPFYALALKEKTKKPVIGVQFIELTRKPSRSKGIFFDKWNGKTPGNLTNTRSKLNVFNTGPDEICNKVDAEITATLEAIQRKEFHVRPKFETECRLCSYMDLCQKRRLKTAEPEVASEA